MEIHYTDGWFRAKKRPGELWSSERAHSSFKQRTLYAAVIGPLKHPTAFMEFNRDWIGVNFLDRLLRVYLNYSFVEVEPGRMFLTMSTYREFEGLSDNVKNGTTYIFKQDGLVLLREQDVTNKVLRTSKRMAGRVRQLGQVSQLRRI
jgi:hypothetical protein